MILVYVTKSVAAKASANLTAGEERDILCPKYTPKPYGGNWEQQGPGYKGDKGKGEKGDKGKGKTGDKGKGKKGDGKP